MKYVFQIVIVLFVTLLTTSCFAHKHTSKSQDNVNESNVFYEPEQTPHYLNGGEKGLLSDFYTTLSKTAPVTQDAVKGRAVVTVTILKDGSIDPNSIRILRNRSVPTDYMNAAIEAIKALGKFETGKMNGVPLNVRLNLPVRYPVPLEHIKTNE